MTEKQEEVKLATPIYTRNANKRYYEKKKQKRYFHSIRQLRHQNPDR